MAYIHDRAKWKYVASLVWIRFCLPSHVQRNVVLLLDTTVGFN